MSTFTTSLGFFYNTIRKAFLLIYLFLLDSWGAPTSYARPRFKRKCWTFILLTNDLFDGFGAVKSAAAVQTKKNK